MAEKDYRVYCFRSDDIAKLVIMIHHYENKFKQNLPNQNTPSNSPNFHSNIVSHLELHGFDGLWNVVSSEKKWMFKWHGLNEPENEPNPIALRAYKSESSYSIAFIDCPNLDYTSYNLVDYVKKHNLYLAQILARFGRPHIEVKEALAISYSWKRNLLDVLMYAYHSSAEGQSSFIWLDIVNINQNSRDIGEELNIIPIVYTTAKHHTMISRSDVHRGWCFFECVLRSNAVAKSCAKHQEHATTSATTSPTEQHHHHIPIKHLKLGIGSALKHLHMHSPHSEHKEDSPHPHQEHHTPLQVLASHFSPHEQHQSVQKHASSFHNPHSPQSSKEALNQQEQKSELEGTNFCEFSESNFENLGWFCRYPYLRPLEDFVRRWTFTFDNAQFTVESDRGYVHQKITELFGDVKKVEENLLHQFMTDVMSKHHFDAMGYAVEFSEDTIQKALQEVEDTGLWVPPTIVEDCRKRLKDKHIF